MRKICSIGVILILILITFAGVIFAKKVDLSMAKRIGIVQLKAYSQTRLTQGLSSVGYSIQSIRPLEDTRAGRILAYILDLKPTGFIAISTDTNIRPVIAYSYHNNFSIEDVKDNVLLHMLKQDMRYRLEAIPIISEIKKSINNQLWEEYLSEEKSQTLIYELANADQWPEDNTGWLNTTWEQGGFYNNSCPDDPNTWWWRCDVGCAAVAMGQVIYYWRYLDSVSFTSSDRYVSKYDPGDGNGERVIHIDEDHEELKFPSFDELNTSLANISYSGDKQKIADLLFACGISVKMKYSDNGSAAILWYPGDDTDAESGLKNKFGYQANGKWESDGDFYPVLKNNMKEGEPALLQICKEGKENSCKDGHAVVADGFRSTGEYHLNFGGGAGTPDSISEAWYFLPYGMPSGYSIVYCGVLNINPFMSTNNPPNTPPAPTGESAGTPNTSYTFTATTTDPDGDQVAYKFDWGDDNKSDWTSYVDSGKSTSRSHSWSIEDTYYVKVKAKDKDNGAESDWSDGHTIVISVEAPILEVDPGSLAFGEVEVPQTKTTTFRVCNAGTGTLSGTISDDRDWITVDPTSFESNDITISVTIDTSIMAETWKEYTGTVTVFSNGGTKTVDVSVTPTCVRAFPNPFNPRDGKLTFWGTGVCYATIRIYTLSGELIKTLYEETGNDKVYWNGKNEEGKIVANGTYLYLAISPQEKNIGRFVVIKK